MKKAKILVIIVLSLSIYSCRTIEREIPEPIDVIDADGNVYKSVVIGYQLWMKENLRTTKYSDGTPILNILDNQEWLDTKTTNKAAYAWIQNDSAKWAVPWGALYNWYAVDRATNGNKNLCPAGWRVPSRKDWDELIKTVGGIYIGGLELMDTGTVYWYYDDWNVATNSSGFSAIPAGNRGNLSGLALGYGKYANYWTSTNYSKNEATEVELEMNTEPVRVQQQEKYNGNSIRCIKE